MNEQDDMDNWKQVTMAGMSTKARQIPQNVSMGIGHKGSQTNFPGDLAENFISENNQRHFYFRWQEFMNATSWADIKIDPITAKFEGTATMRS